MPTQPPAVLQPVEVREPAPAARNQQGQREMQGLGFTPEVIRTYPTREIVVREPMPDMGLWRAPRKIEWV